MATRNIENVKLDASEMRREWVTSELPGNKPSAAYIKALWKDYKEGLGDPLTPANTWPIFKAVLIGGDGAPLSKTAVKALRIKGANAKRALAETRSQSRINRGTMPWQKKIRARDTGSSWAAIKKMFGF